MKKGKSNKLGRRILSFVLTAALVVGLMPGNMLTVSAEGIEAGKSEEIVVETVSSNAASATIECTCETDDPAFHATNCPAYIAPENPQCYCAEKCTEDTLNVWCDVCGVQGVSTCQGEDAAVAYDTTMTEPSTTTIDGQTYYQLGTVEEYLWFSNLVNNGTYDVNAILTADITFTEPYTPLGTSKSSSYTGIFDGDGHTIELRGGFTTGDSFGIFGHNNGTIKDIKVYLKDTGTIGDYFGGIVGHNDSEGTISGCTCIAPDGSDVINTQEYAGGIAGYNKGTISDCINNRYLWNATSAENVGGIVGINFGTVTDCSNTGRLRNGSIIGGIAGYNDGKIENCSNSGQIVDGEDNVGGIVGQNDSNSKLINCHNTAPIGATGYGVGGVTGENSGSITMCSNLGEVIVNSYSARRIGGIVGSSYSGTVTKSFNKGNVTSTSAYIENGGIAGYNRQGIISDCYNLGTLDCIGNRGGCLIGFNNGGGTVINCYGSGNACPGYQNAGTYANCYYTGSAGFTLPGGNMGITTVTDEELASGKVTYLLNNHVTDGTQIWYQTIGEDQIPVLDSTRKTVYRKCNGTSYAYSNDGESTHAYSSECDEVCNSCEYVRTATQPHTESIPANCSKPAHCDACDSDYGEKLNTGHNFNPENGVCSGCGITAALKYQETDGGEWEIREDFPGDYNNGFSGTVSLYRDISIGNVAVDSGQEATIILNGHRINSNKTIFVFDGGKLTLDATDNGGLEIPIENYGEIIIKGKMVNKYSSVNSIRMYEGSKVDLSQYSGEGLYMKYIPSTGITPELTIPDKYIIKGATGQGEISETTYEVSQINQNMMFIVVPEHTHAWSYELADNVITEKCTADECYLAEGIGGTLKLGVTEAIYTGSEIPVTLQNTLRSVASVEVVYTDSAQNPVGGIPVNAGTYTASVTLDDKTVSVTYTIEPKELIVLSAVAKDKVYDGTKKVEITNIILMDASGNVITEDDGVSADLNSFTGSLADANVGDYTNATLSGLTLTGINSGNYELKYNNEEVPVRVSVTKATPNVTAVPTVADRIYNPTVELADNDMTGDTVKGVDGNSLAGGWSWQTANIIPVVNNSGYIAVFTPTDSTNYETVTRTITVTVTKATPNITTNPTASAITYGQTLDQSVLSNAVVDCAGNFAWADGTVKPAVADSNNTEYDVEFTPTDADNYNVVETKLTLTVNKSETTPNMPESTMSVLYSKKTVGAVTLPEGWVWNDSDKATELPLEEEVSATATYNGTDKGNYVTESIEITLIRKDCTHEEGKEVLYTGEGEKAPTCTEAGIGHTECTKCQEPMQTNVSVEATEHTWDNGVVTKEPTAIQMGEKTYTCSVCKTTKTEEIPALGAPKVGTQEISDDGKAIYKVTTSDLAKGTVTYVAPTNKKVATVTIPDVVVIDGVTYKVTAIEKKAFKNNKNIKKVTIGKNVKTIGKEAFSGCKKMTSISIGKNVSKIDSKAFYGCSKLKTLTIKSSKLTTKKIGSKAFSKTPKSMTVKVPKKKFNAYKSMLIKRGVNKKAKFKKS